VHRDLEDHVTHQRQVVLDQFPAYGVVDIPHDHLLKQSPQCFGAYPTLLESAHTLESGTFSVLPTTQTARIE
jgi:hypothetical protein